MFSSRPNFNKLKTNLKLCINRLKLLEKKKSELALKSRIEIAEYIKNEKYDRARIRVEGIVREDYLVEAMEIIEMFCDALETRFGLIERMKDLDPGIEEAVATILWVAPRLSNDVPELREVAHQLCIKYGKEFAEACSRNTLNNVNEKVVHKMSISSPPKILVENYMVEIAKSYKVAFEPDPLIMAGEAEGPGGDDLIHFNPDPPPGGPSNYENKYPLPGEVNKYPGQQEHNQQQPQFPFKPQQPQFPLNPQQPSQPHQYPVQPHPHPNNQPYQPVNKAFDYPQIPQKGSIDQPNPDQAPYPVAPSPLYPNDQYGNANPFQRGIFSSNPPAYSSTSPNAPSLPPNQPQSADDSLMNLPDVPSGTHPGGEGPPPPPPTTSFGQSDDLDFDDLAKRFEDLKKKK